MADDKPGGSYVVNVQTGRDPSRPAFVLGFLVLVLSVVANVWVVERIASPDGEFDADTKAVLLVLNALATATGAWVVWCKGHAWPALWLVRFAARHPKSAEYVGGLIFTVLLIGLAEIVFYNLNVRALRVAVHYDGAEIHQYEPYLGYRPVANQQLTGTMTYGDEHVYTATYSFDEYSRRITPDPYPDRSRETALLVFGGSFAFGSGVEDDETLAYRLAEHAPDLHVYNYAYGGWGVQQMLALLEQPGFGDQVAERRARIIYVYIPAHIGRTTGSLRNVTWFGRHFPCYEYDRETDAVRRIGSFAEAWPKRMALYDLIAKEQVARYVYWDYPRIGAVQLDHVAAVFVEAKRVVETKFENVGFDVVIFPEHPNNSTRANEIVPYLEKRGVGVIDCSSLFDTGESEFLIPRDLHPTAKAHAELADAVMKEIGP